MSAELHDVLARAGLTLVEHYVLGAVGIGVHLEPDALARHCLAVSEGDPRGTSSIEAHRGAVASLIARGLLEQVTGAAREVVSVPRLMDGHHERPGTVHLTREGTRVYREVLVALHGQARLDHMESGYNVLPGIGLEVLAPTEALCVERCREIADDPRSYAGEDVLHVQVDPPRPIGPWSPRRFVERASGFRAVVHLARRRG